MSEATPVALPSSEIMRQLRRLTWIAQGRAEAFQFALECEGTLNTLLEELSNIEELLTKPHMLAGPMAPTAGPRIFRDGYISALKEVIALVRDAQEGT